MKTPETVTIPRELAQSAADVLWRLKRFADHAETIALTIKQLPKDSYLIGFQAEMLINLHSA